MIGSCRADIRVTDTSDQSVTALVDEPNGQKCGARRNLQVPVTDVKVSYLTAQG